MIKLDRTGFLTVFLLKYQPKIPMKNDLLGHFFFSSIKFFCNALRGIIEQ